MIEFINSIWNRYSLVIEIIIVGSMIVWIILMLRSAFRPGQQNMKLNWSCPDCDQSGTIYFSEIKYWEEAYFGYHGHHNEVSPYCHSNNIALRLDKMSDAEIKQQNEKAAQKVKQ
jgi:hypothetical protein